MRSNNFHWSYVHRGTEGPTNQCRKYVSRAETLHEKYSFFSAFKVPRILQRITKKSCKLQYLYYHLVSIDLVIDSYVLKLWR